MGKPDYLKNINVKEKPMKRLWLITGLLTLTIVLLPAGGVDTGQNEIPDFVIGKFMPGGTAENLTTGKCRTQ